MDWEDREWQTEDDEKRVYRGVILGVLGRGRCGQLCSVAYIEAGVD
jgi:hypothetical protein